MVSHTYPIVRDGKFLGISGVDRGLDVLAGTAHDIKARLGADVFILSAGGRFIAATTDGAGGVAAAAPLQMREVAGTAYAPLAARWRSGVGGGRRLRGDRPRARRVVHLRDVPRRGRRLERGRAPHRGRRHAGGPARPSRGASSSGASAWR